jgi:uncharacterized protein (TIGR03790 family)
MTFRPLRLLLLPLLVPAAQALGPHEVLLLVNRQSETSLEVANHYARLRRIPAQNIIHLDVPEGALAERAEISWADFQRTIREPVAAEVKRRGLADHALGWAYAPDFPVRITGDGPALSLQGATYVGAQRPAPASVQTGQYHAPTYAGPDRPQGPFAESPQPGVLRRLAPGSHAHPQHAAGLCRGAGHDRGADHRPPEGGPQRRWDPADRPDLVCHQW